MISYYGPLRRLIRKPGEYGGLLPDKVHPEDSSYGSRHDKKGHLQVPRKKQMVFSYRSDCFFAIALNEGPICRSGFTFNKKKNTPLPMSQRYFTMHLR